MISLWLNPEDHLRTLSLVLEGLRFAGFKMNKTKWKFLQQSVVYLGQKLNEEGLQPTDDKLAAIRDAPRAKHVTTFKSFLGLIMYVLFTVHATSFHCTVTSSQSAQEIYPLDVVQNWRRCIVTGFSDISILWSHAVPVRDASSYGGGAVLSHKTGGQFRPVAFASATLTSAQQK